jgi:CheY-like chemotaxis protein
VFTFSCWFKEGQEGSVVKKSARRVVGLAPGSGRKTILVVDDKEENRRFMVELLSLAGFATQEAANGEEALASFEIAGPDLVLMDMRMPVMDGYEATRRIKAMATGRETPVIAVSASVLEEDRNEILAAGADNFIPKPFRESELFAAIGKLLGIEYHYVNDEAAAPTIEAPVQLIRKGLEALPEELREELRQSLLALNVGAIQQIIGRVHLVDRSLGESMARLSRDYQFEVLLDMVKKC